MATELFKVWTFFVRTVREPDKSDVAHIRHWPKSSGIEGVGHFLYTTLCCQLWPDDLDWQHCELFEIFGEKIIKMV